VTSHKLLWIDAASTPSPGRSCHMPLDTIHSVQKRVQYGLNVMNPKVRLEVKVFVDRHSKLTNSKWATNSTTLTHGCVGISRRNNTAGQHAEQCAAAVSETSPHTNLCSTER
jgi:hypothetical protein